jgi:hypothetical protein
LKYEDLDMTLKAAGLGAMGVLAAFAAATGTQLNDFK